MNERMLQYWTNLKQYWNKFNRTYKVLIVGTILLSAAAVVFIIYNNSKVEYAMAFSDLQPNDASSITKYLTDNNIPYMISEDGKSIGVPRSMVAKVKVDVVGQGLNNSGTIGWGVFRENSLFGRTDAQTEIMKLEAMQGELEQLINTNVAVSSSKVMITVPETSVFVREKEPPTASVVLNTKPGYTLDQPKVDTMYLLVSKSVPNLTVENITISDQNGDLLPYSKSSTGQFNAGTAAAQQFQVKREFEQDLRKEIKALLGPIIGPNRVLPMVVATLNFDKKTTSSNLVTPVNGESGVVLSEQVAEKSSTNGSTGGVPGTGETDVPTYPGGTDSNNSNAEESSRTTNYEINRIKEDIESQPFYVTDLTVSVGLDNSVEVPQTTKDAIQKLLTSLVKTSLANNGRAVTAEELAEKVTVFDQTFAASAAEAEAQKTNWMLYGGAAAAAVALAATGGFVIASRRRKTQQAALEEAAIAEAPAKVEFPTIDLENITNENQARKQLEQLAKKKPEEFVNLLRTWLVDE